MCLITGCGDAAHGPRPPADAEFGGQGEWLHRQCVLVVQVHPREAFGSAECKWLSFFLSLHLIA